MVTITLVTIKRLALENYIKQLKKFFNGKAMIIGYAMEDEPSAIEGDVILVTSYFLMKTVKRNLSDPATPVLHISNTFSQEQINRISGIPAGSKVLVVNSTKEIIYDCISQLEQTVGKDLTYIAYSEQEDKNINPSDYMYALTFFEDFHNAHFVKNIIKLGSRLIHPYIFQWIIERYFSDDQMLRQSLHDYNKQMVSISYSAIEAENLEKEYEEILKNILFMTDHGVILLDDSNAIRGINEKAQEILNVSSEDLYGRPLEYVPALQELYHIIDKAGENVQIQVNSRYLTQTLLLKKRVIQFYSYRFMTALFLENLNQREAGGERRMRAKFTFNDIVGSSQKILNSIEIAKQISYSDNAVLLNGETGTGKEIFAQAIHNRSRRSHEPFLTLNCAAFPESILESELFGYEPGTFTGALKSGKKGLFELADGGTIFLDEIGDAPLSVQAKLLRVLQEKEIRRIGGDENLSVNVRIISATNRDLKEMIKDGRFRMDLYYRLNTFTITIPPLRERLDDIEPLVHHFLKQEQYGYKRVDKEVISYLQQLPWEGNVRELQNCVEYMGFMSGDRITVQSLPEEYKVNLSNFTVQGASSAGHAVDGFARKDQNAVLFILETLYFKSVGRNTLLADAKEKNINLTEYHLKRLLSQLSAQGFIKIKTGRGGIDLTEKGELAIR